MPERLDRSVVASVAEGAKQGFTELYRGAQIAKGFTQSIKTQTIKMSSSMRRAAENFWNSEAVQAMRGFFSNIYGSIKGHIDEVLGPFKEVLDIAVESVKKIAGFFKGIFAPLFQKIFGIGGDDTGEEQVSWLKKLYRFFVKDASRRRKRLARTKGDEEGKAGWITAALILLGGIIIGFVGQTTKVFASISKMVVGLGRLAGSVIGRLAAFFKMEGQFGKVTKFFGKIFGAEGYIAKVAGKLGGLIAKIEKAGIIGRIFRIGKFFGVFLWWFGLIWDLYKGFTEAGEGAAAKIRGVTAGLINWLLDLPELFYNWVVAPIFGLKKISITREKISEIILAATQWVTDHITIPLWDFFNVTLPGLWQSFKSTVFNIQKPIRFISTWIMENIIIPVRDFFMITIPSIFTTFKERILGIGDTIKAGLESAWENIKGLFSGIGEAIAEGVKGVWDFIKDLFNPAKIAEAIKESVKKKAGAAWESIKGWFGGDEEEKPEPVEKPEAVTVEPVAEQIDKANERKEAMRRQRERQAQEAATMQTEATKDLSGKVDESTQAARESNVAVTNVVANQQQQADKGTDVEEKDDSLLSLLTFGILQ